MSERHEFLDAFQAGGSASLTAAHPKVAQAGGVPYLVLPPGLEVHPLGGEFLEAPLRRIEAAPSFTSVSSFITYVKRFAVGGDKSCAIFADPRGERVTAILDYHAAADKPRHGSHRPTLILTLSENWKWWTGIDRKPQSQIPFAEFLEDNIQDIAEPDGSEIMAAVTALEINREVAFKSAVDLSDGTRSFAYQDAAGVKNSVALPKALTLSLPVYAGDEDGANEIIQARLRYKLTDDKVWFTVVLDNPASVVRGAFASVVAHLKEELGTGILIGTP